MENNFLCIVFRYEAKNSDTWNFVKFRSTEPIYNQVIMGDLT